ncbi:MAG: hypothetical protein ACM3VW_09800 [Bacteroidota bacterium]
MRVTRRVMTGLLLLMVFSAGVAVAQGGPGRPGGAAASGAAPPAKQLNWAHWHDMVHYAGITNALLASLTFLGGLTLFLGFEVRGKKWTDPTRRKIRYVHMTLGITAIAAGLTHYLGRSVQFGHFYFGTIPPALCFYGFVLLLLSGILRYWTPKAFFGVRQIFPYLHRLGFIVALYYLFQHTKYQISRFAGPRA